MEKRLNNSKILMISHIADIDGMGSVILAYLAFKDIDYVLIEPKEQEEMLDFIKKSDYEQIYICDLGLGEKIGSEINTLNKNILLFDHHQSNLSLNKYPFAKVEVMLNNRKTSGTELFYDYLVNQKLLNPNQAITEFVELIRSYDTWDWYYNEDVIANDLTTLFNVIGTSLFIDYFKENLIKLDRFSFSEEHRFLIDLREKEISKVIKNCNQSMIKINFESLTAGVVFSDRYSSRIGNQLCLNHKIDFAIIIDMIENCVSLRSIGETDVSVIAKKYYGGGHKNAAGFPLESKTKSVLLRLVADNIS